MQAMFAPLNMSVLILGIYLSNKKNHIKHIVEEFSASSQWKVVQKWIAIGEKAPAPEVSNVTTTTNKESAPKFVLLNSILSKENLDSYDFVIICDDDITLPRGFLKTYLDLVLKYDFALAQPARTHDSFIDWPFVEQLDGLNARRTHFVEIGPLFSVRTDIFSEIFPFDESCYMGWGFDFVWPCLIHRLALRMGIIDATPVNHSLRKPVNYYEHADADQSMQDYLSRHPHLSKGDAFLILESYAKD